MRTAFPIEYGNVIGMTHPHMATYTKRVNNEGSWYLSSIPPGKTYKKANWKITI